MAQTTRTGKTYRSRPADRALTRRRFSTLGTAVVVAASVALIAVLVHPPILGWFW